MSTRNRMKYPIRALLLLRDFHLLVIDGEAFLFRSKECKHVKLSEYTALCALGWIGPAQVITERVQTHEVTAAGYKMAAKIAAQAQLYEQLCFDFIEFAEDDEQQDEAPMQQQSMWE